MSPAAEITADRLHRFASRCDAATLAPIMAAECARCAIDTPARVAHFMAQTFEESGGFTRFAENLNYTSGARLMAVWPRRFPSMASTAGVVSNPEALANKVYGGRGGNTAPGDGWRYRGRGLIAITFHDNYHAASGWTGLDLVANPDSVATPAVGIKVAADFWRTHDLTRFADKGDVVGVFMVTKHALTPACETAFQGETQLINGGLTNLDHRRQALQAASAIWAP